MKKIKIFEAFAWYGGASFALKKAWVNYEVVGYSENDRFASMIFENNHPWIKNFWDITKINPQEIPDFDIFTWWFPCQPFSSAWLWKGELDIRGTLFYDIIRICEEKKPQHIFLENVKWITTQKHKHTFNKIISELSTLWYDIRWELLNTKDFWIPQNRERVWIYGYRGKLDESFILSPNKIILQQNISHFLDKAPEKHLFLSEKQIQRLIDLHHLDFNVKTSCCLDIYNKKIKTDGTCITITEPHHNSLRIVHPPKDGKFIVRKLSITEHYRLMGFKDWEFNFWEFSYQQLCKRAWNGWDVHLVSKIFKQIFN